MPPILTILDPRFGQILAGAIVVEGIFFVIVNLLTDLAYVAFDPRIRLGAAGRS